MSQDTMLGTPLLFLLTLSKCQTRLRDTLMRLICFQCREQSLFEAALSPANIVQSFLTVVRAEWLLEALPLSPRLCGPARLPGSIVCRIFTSSSLNNPAC